jgi:exosome complex RNA-binding protein Rrp4
MIIGQNGRIWIDGELSGMSETRKAMDVIRDTAHLPGLNERVAALATE